MKFAYEDLSSGQFEDLIVLICQEILGLSTQGFATGTDGGRDARFEGAADKYPSNSSPWNGKVIIQAKHTNGINRSFSENDFFSSDSSSCIVAEEVPKIKKLKYNEELDHYLLFANRRLTGNTENDIRTHISEQCDIESGSIRLCGIEQIEIWLKSFPNIANLAKLDPVDSPLIVSPNDLAEVVEALAKGFDEVDSFPEMPPVPRTSYKEKNELNNMTVDYADVMRKKYLKQTAQIQSFLAAPENIAIMHAYEAVVDEFQAKITAKRSDYQTFDNVMNYLVDLLFKRDAVLRQRKHKKLTRAVVFYMYWNCDIGKSTDAPSN